MMLLPSEGSEVGGATGLLQAGNLPIDKAQGGAWTAGKTETGGDVNGLYIPSTYFSFPMRHAQGEHQLRDGLTDE